MTDAQLLEAYSSRQDEAAFGELMRRHGAMVYRACHRLLKDAHEAEDASQAVFVVLARKAGGLRKGDLAAWLYRVAHLVASETVRKRMRRTGREVAYAEDAAIQVGEDTPDEAADPAVLELVDAALLSLPERYRQAVILRYLQNHSQEDAARLAGCPLGTLSSRASEGIARLRQRLAKRGVALGGVALAGLLTSEASASVPETLLPSILATVKSAVTTTATATTATSTAAMLAKGAMKAMFWNSVKTAAMVMVSVGVVGVGGVAAVQAVAEKADTTAKPVPISHKGVGSEAESFAARFKMVGVVIRADSSKSIALDETGAVTSRTFFVSVGDKVNDHILVAINYENASATFAKDKSTTTLSMSNAVRSGVAGAPPLPRGIALQRQMHDRIATNMDYESRLRERREKIRTQTNALTRTREDLDKVLMQYQMEQIRKGRSFLPVKLTPEADDTLVKEGVLPPTGGTEHGTPGRGAGADAEGQGGE